MGWEVLNVEDEVVRGMSNDLSLACAITNDGQLVAGSLGYHLST